MAAVRGISHNLYTHISHPNPQLFFFRGFSSKLFVKDISFSTTEETLAEAFSKFGEVTEAKIIRDKVRNRSKGYGYVSFAKEDEAKRALMDMNGKLLDGRAIFVDPARPSRHFDSVMRVASGPPKPVVPPAYYAHLAAFHARFYMEPEMQENGSTGGGVGHGAKGTRAAGESGVQPLPALKENVKRVMFYR